MNWLTTLLYKLAKAKLDPNASAQGVHFSIGMLIVLWTAFMGGPILWAAAGATVFATVIEFWFDATFEGQPFWDNFEDFCFYLLGAWGTYLLILLL